MVAELIHQSREGWGELLEKNPAKLHGLTRLETFFWKSSQKAFISGTKHPLSVKAQLCVALLQ